MKKTYQYIALAVLTLGMAACTQEDDFTPQGNQKDAPLAIASAGVADLSTRATITEGNLTGGSIGVYVTSTTNKDRYKGSNIEWTYNNGWETTATEPVLFEDNGEAQRIGAYYPYNENLGADNTYSIELPEIYGADYENYDYLYADYAPLSSNPATITMNHLMAKVTVSITSQGSEIGTDAVSDVSLFDVPRTASWTVPTSTLSLGTSNQTTTLYANDTNNDQTVDNYVGYALPNSATTLGIRVTMSGGRSFIAKAPITDGLASGNHYIISMRLGKDALTMGCIIIGDWATPENNPTGSEATEVFIHSTVWGTTAAIDIVSGATDGVKAAIEALFTDNPMVTTLTVNGTPNEVQQGALAEVLTAHSGVKLIMDMNEDEVSEAVTDLTNEKQLGGYTLATVETTTTYTVYTEAGLNKWKEEVEKGTKTNLTLGADIILSTEGITVDENGKPNKSNWIVKEIPPFEGSLEGDGHSIVNLRIISSGIDPAGFIGKVAGATIKNLTIVNPVAYGRQETQAGLVCVVGTSEHPTSIINCHVQGGSIGGAASFAGGLIGLIRYNVNQCYIYGCTNSAKVTGSYNSGGILGDSPSVIGDDVVIAACANTGEISGGSKAGGIAGTVHSKEKLIACYTTQGNIYGDMDATVTGSYYVASEDTDGKDGTTAVADAEALNNADVVNAMNAAINTWNNSATVKVAYRWKVGTTLPILEADPVSE